MTRDERDRRFGKLRDIGCIACLIEGCRQPMPTEIHHLNLDGKAGQKRRGDDCTVPLCTFHHRGEPPKNMTASEATFYFGPSLARSSKLFRFTYGSDNHLLSLTNTKLELA